VRVLCAPLQRCASRRQQHMADVARAAMLTAPSSFGTWACGARRTRTGALSCAARPRRRRFRFSCCALDNNSTSRSRVHPRASASPPRPQSALRFGWRSRRRRCAWRGRRFAHTGPRRHAEALAGACAATCLRPLLRR
jgi:hypothetical protein